MRTSYHYICYNGMIILLPYGILGGMYLEGRHLMLLVPAGKEQ
jgi:hypothetical protein